MRRLIAAAIPFVCSLFIDVAHAEFERHGPQTGASKPSFVMTVEGRANAHRRVAKHKRAKTAVVAKRRDRGMQVASADPSGGFGGGSNLVAEARRYLGGNPTGRSSLWCADFMNLVLERVGMRGTGSRLARDFAHYGQRVAGPVVGAIAVMSRGRRGGHVGVVSGVDEKGRVIVISGNHGRRVAEAPYSPGRIYAYVMPR